MKRFSFLSLAVGSLCLVAPVVAQSPQARITVDAGQVINRVSPWIYGSCIEDVNHEIYGGLYDQKIFGESFEEPPAPPKLEGWTVYGGSWRSDGTIVSVGAAEGAKIVRNTPDFTDDSVEAEIKFPDRRGDNAGILVRVRNAGIGMDNFDGYEVSLSANRQTVLLGRHRHDWKMLSEVPASVTPNQWHRLRVEMLGPRLRVFVNGGAVPLIDYTDTEAPLLSGSFALRTWKSDASFQNVRVGTEATPIPFKAAESESVSGQWDGIKTGGDVEFLRDNINPYNGAWCQMLYHGAGAGLIGVANRGLNRWGIAVEKGRSYQGRLYLRARNLQGPVTLALQSADGKQTYATQGIPRVGTDWAKYPINLVSKNTDANARFAVYIDRPGTLWLDQVVLTGSGEKQFKGLPFRADIANAMVGQGLTFLRYGGTMVNAPEYRWKKMLGDPDRRPPYRGHWYPYSTNGFGIEEFLKFCEAAGFEPSFAINIEETAQDAADMVEYLNGPVTSLWGRRRAENGHPKPYNVRYIEIGNEEVIGSDDAAGYDHYVERFKVLSAAMRARDPQLQLVNAAWWRPESPNMERVFKALNGLAAYWDLHVWSDAANAGTDVDRQLTQMKSLFEKWVPGATMKCVIFEENGGLHNMQRALGHATTLNAVRRHGDFVLVSCPANALQPWQQNDNGWDQGQVFFTPNHVWGMPPYSAQQMASQNHLPLRISGASEGAATLDVTATRSNDGKTLVLHVANTGAVAQQAGISISGFDGYKPTAQTWTLAGAPQATNPPDGPETIRSQHSTIQTAGSQFSYNFPAHSYVVLRLTR